MSTTHTSGGSSPTRCSNACPSATWAVTSNPASASTMDSPSRNNTASSATITLIPRASHSGVTVWLVAPDSGVVAGGVPRLR
jgi:hypothetical protein